MKFATEISHIFLEKPPMLFFDGGVHRYSPEDANLEKVWAWMGTLANHMCLSKSA
jgi:hypothetical protein